MPYNCGRCFARVAVDLRKPYLAQPPYAARGARLGQENDSYSYSYSSSNRTYPSLLNFSWVGMAHCISWYSSLLSRYSSAVDITKSSGAWVFHARPGTGRIRQRSYRTQSFPPCVPHKVKIRHLHQSVHS